MATISIQDLTEYLYTNGTVSIDLDATITNDETSSLVPEDTTYEITIEPTHGTATITDNKLTYTHNGTNNDDSLSYAASNNGITSNDASIVFIINSGFDAPFIKDMTIQLINDISRKYVLLNNHDNYYLIYRFIDNATNEISENVTIETGELTIIDNNILLLEKVFNGETTISMRVYRTVDEDVDNEYLSSLTDAEYKDITLRIITNDIEIQQQCTYNSYSTKLSIHESNLFYKEANNLFQVFKRNSTIYTKQEMPLSVYANDIYEIVRLLFESLKLYKYNQDALRLFKTVSPFAIGYREYNSDLDKLLNTI